MKRSALLIFVLFFLSAPKVDGQGIDSLNISSTFITLGETWYTDYFTGYSVYTNRSFFKDESGGLHVVFLANYELYYCYSDDGLVWSTEHIMSTHDGDFSEAVIYADDAGNPFIAVTINPFYNYGNPTGVSYGDEFRYSVYYFVKEGGIWVEEEVFNSTQDPGWSGNFGCRVNELYKNMNGEMVLIGARYGWYTYGGAFWEFTRDTEGNWSEASIIHNYNDTPVDHATDAGRIYLKSSGVRHLIYSRPYNSNGIPELAYMKTTDGVWGDPIVLTTDLLNYRAWDMSIDADEEMYLIHYSNTPTPHINMYTDFDQSTQLPVDLSMVDTLQSVKIHVTENGILDLLVYPLNTDTAILYASEDFGATWSAPIYLEKRDFPGVLPVTDQYSNQGVDLEFIRVSRVSNTEPFGPDSLFYHHIEQINSTTVGVSDHTGRRDSFSFYPNPLSDIVTVNYALGEPGRLNVRIFTLQGKMIVDKNYQGNIGDNQIRLDLGHLDSGTYIIEVFELDSSRDQLHKASGKIIKL
jgi:hypothetical protein